MQPISVGWAKLPGTAIMIARRRAILPRGCTARSGRVGNAPVRRAALFEVRRVAHPTGSLDMFRGSRRYQSSELSQATDHCVTAPASYERVTF